MENPRDSSTPGSGARRGGAGGVSRQPNRRYWFCQSGSSGLAPRGGRGTLRGHSRKLVPPSRRPEPHQSARAVPFLTRLGHWIGSARASGVGRSRNVGFRGSNPRKLPFGQPLARSSFCPAPPFGSGGAGRGHKGTSAQGGTKYACSPIAPSRYALLGDKQRRWISAWCARMRTSSAGEYQRRATRAVLAPCGTALPAALTSAA